MDIFSVGCVIAELFLEAPIFTLSQLFKYRLNKEYDPTHIHLSRIADKEIRDMVAHMIHVDPQDRYSADEIIGRNEPAPDRITLKGATERPADPADVRFDHEANHAAPPELASFSILQRELF